MSDWDNLRTLASPSGDAGKDSALFEPEEEPNVVIQYSVRADWPAKIRATAKTLREKGSQAQLLVYVTNQVIGAKADDLRKELREKYRFSLDVRDRAWFMAANRTP